MSKIVVKKCKGCGSTDFRRDIHSASSDLACSKCGRVFEENPIVSEVTFGESSNGAAVVQGSFVGPDQSTATFASGPRGSSMDSRTKTLASAKRKIRAVSNALKIPEYVSEAAYQWFSLALTNNFVKGRRSQNVIASCLYIACRKEKTHHMLIDFSSRLQISVYSVGSTFLKMVKVLHITNLPLADPSLFIQHFAEKLDFGDEKLKVVRDAVKLAQRMSEDWIHEGRRPAGIAGACLLLAARMNNFRRTHSEIVAVAHVGEETLQRRLNEFCRTDAAGLTVDEFRKTDQFKNALPPSYRNSLIRNAKLVKEVKATDFNYAEALKAVQIENDSDEKPKDIEDHDLMRRLLVDTDVDSVEILDQLERVKQRQQKTVQRVIKTNNLIIDIDEYVNENEDGTLKTPIIEPDLDRPRNLHKLPTTSQVLSAISSHPTDFDDISDDEIEDFLLTEEEALLKERVWVGLNEEFLLDQERKRLKAEADEISGHHQPKRRRKPKTEKEAIDALDADGVESALNSIGENSSASAAARSMITKKAPSRKINYSALNDLFGS